VQAIISANIGTVRWLKSCFEELSLKTHDRKPQKRNFLERSFKKQFLKMRIYHWFDDYDEQLGNTQADSEEAKKQKMLWKQAPSIFVAGSVPFAKVQLLAPAVNFLSLEHDQKAPRKFVGKTLRNDYQVVRNMPSILFGFS
jgi:hypothetical protein